MKKLQNLGKSLNRNDQKRILGGYEGEGACSYTYVPGSGTCGVRHNGQTVSYGMDHDRAIEIANYCTWSTGSAWYWCCASC